MTVTLQPNSFEIISSDTSICSTEVSLQCEMLLSHYVVVSVSIEFPSKLKRRCPFSTHSLWIFSYWLGESFVLQWFPFSGQCCCLIMLLSQFPLNFLRTQKRVPLFIPQLVAILVLIRAVIVVTWEILHRRISLNFVLLLLVLNFLCELILKTKSSLIHLHDFQLFCAAVIAHRNHFFRLYKQNKSSPSKVKFRV